MTIITITNHLLQENTYLIHNETASLIVDPGSDTDRILATVTQLAKPVAAILLTHAHFDHIIGLDTVREAVGHPPVYVSELEQTWLSSPDDNLSQAFGQAISAQPADQIYSIGQTYQMAGLTFQVLPTPGHSWGGVSLVFPEMASILSGDALFRGSVGRTDLPTSDYAALISGIKNQLLTLPDHYKVYPGHGPSTTIGHEARSNPHLL